MIIASSPRDDDGCRTLQPRIRLNKWFSKKTDLAVGGNQNFQVTARTVGFFLSLLVLKKETKREIPCACACCRCLAQARCDQNGHLENETTTQILPEKKCHAKQAIWFAMCSDISSQRHVLPRPFLGRVAGEAVSRAPCSQFIARDSCQEGLFSCGSKVSSVPVQRAR